MKDYLNLINDNYPIRRTKSQKEKFREFIKNEISNTKYDFRVETLDNSHNNIIIGDVEKANVIFTAHYDTPATSIVPNLMFPRNRFLGLIYHLGIPVILSILSLLLAYLISNLIINNTKITVILYLFIYLTSFYLLTRCFTNKNNKNDNTSGVATILELATICEKENVAFVLFDDEEKGLLGSKSFNKAHKELLRKKLLVNFDCVGVGENIIFIAKDEAIKHDLYENLKGYFVSNEIYNPLFFPYKGSFANSDFKSFDCSIGVMCCKKLKNIYYTNKIHTNKDKVANKKNIEYIVENIIEFIDEVL